MCVSVCLCWFVSVPRWTNDGGHSSSSRRRRQLMRSFSFVFVHPFRLPIHPLARPIDCHDPSTFFSSPAAAGCHFHLMTACLLIYSSNPEILFPPFWKRKDKKTKQNGFFFFFSQYVVSWLVVVLVKPIDRRRWVYSCPSDRGESISILKNSGGK